MISRREWGIVIVCALLLAALSSTPYLLAASSATASGTVFSGFLFGVEDGYSYLGKMRIGARGVWDFGIFYTSEMHPREPLAFLPYIAPGWLVGRVAEGEARTPALIAAFHLMRVTFDVLLVLVIYRFIAAFTPARAVRLLALALATVGGGLGWLLAFGGDLPPEWFIPEGFTTLILLGLPHLALARSLLLVGFLLLFAAERDDSFARWFAHSALAALCFVGMALCVPFYLTILYALLAAWGFAVWLYRTLVSTVPHPFARVAQAFPARLFWRVLVGGGATLPLFGFYALAFTGNPVFARWTAQNLLPSPPPLHYLLAYGLLALPAFWGMRWAWYHRGRVLGGAPVPHLLLVAWVLVVPLLVYLPFVNVQRRMAEGVLVPLALLAAVGLRLRLARVGSRRRWQARWRLASVGYALLASLSGALLLAGMLGTALTARPPLFLPRAQVAVYHWLDTHAATGDVALCLTATCTPLPAFADLRVFVGHGPETLFLRRKEADVALFYRGELSLDAMQARYMQGFQLLPVRFVLYGPAERTLNDGLPFAWAGQMALVYDADGWQVYEVVGDGVTFFVR